MGEDAGIILDIPYEAQPKEWNTCVPSCLSMEFQYEGLDLKPGDVKTAHDEHNNPPLNNDKTGTYRSQVLQAVDAVDKMYGTNHQVTLYTDSATIVEHGDSHTHRDVFYKTRKTGDHELVNGLPPFRARKADGEVSVQKQIEDEERPVMAWRQGHSILLTGTDGKGFLKHDPAAPHKDPEGPKEHRPVSALERNSITDMFVIKRYE